MEPQLHGVSQPCPREARSSTAGTAPLRREFPIIIDSGARAALVVVRACRPLTVGTRLRHHGMWFKVVEKRPDSGLLVARPVRR